MSVSAYDAIAEWYDESVRSGSLIHDLALPALFALVGPVVGQKVCDLACGQGVVTRHLAERGAAVVGIDVSEKLLAIARRDEESAPLGIVYHHGDAQRLDAIADATFDGVACNMALMDIPHLAAIFHTVRRILRPGGWFVFSIIHPCLETALGRPRLVPDDRDTHEVRSYFVEGPWRSDNPDGVRGRVDAYHRTMSTYLNTLMAAGLMIERLCEPQATGAHAERIPSHRDIPAILAVRCRKAAAHA